MSIPRKGTPQWRVHPGEILREQFLIPMSLSANRLARELHVSPPTVNDIVLERRAVTAEMAVRFARFFGTTEQFWLNLQDAYAVGQAKEHLAVALKEIRPFHQLQQSGADALG
jgi:addiction module HigA family antidote